jgi:hypothetical protein
MMRSPCWRESFTRRGGDHRGAPSSAATPPTSSSSTPKRKKLDSSNKYTYNNRNDSSDKGEGKKKYRFGDKKKFQKMMSRACAALSDLNFSSEDSSS